MARSRVRWSQRSRASISVPPNRQTKFSTLVPSHGPSGQSAVRRHLLKTPLAAGHVIPRDLSLASVKPRLYLPHLTNLARADADSVASPSPAESPVDNASPATIVAVTTHLIAPPP